MSFILLVVKLGLETFCGHALMRCGLKCGGGGGGGVRACVLLDAMRAEVQYSSELYASCPLSFP